MSIKNYSPYGNLTTHTCVVALDVRVWSGVGILS